MLFAYQLFAREWTKDSQAAHAKILISFCASGRGPFISKMSKGGGKALDFEPRERSACPNKEFCLHRWVISGLWTRACVCLQWDDVCSNIPLGADPSGSVPRDAADAQEEQAPVGQETAPRSQGLPGEWEIALPNCSPFFRQPKPTAHPFITPLCK